MAVILAIAKGPFPAADEVRAAEWRRVILSIYGISAEQVELDRAYPDLGEFMADPSWYYTGVDEGGFAAYDDIKALARELDQDEFERRFPVPALLVVYYEPEESDRPVDASSQGGVQLLTMSIKSAAILRYLNRIAFLCKRPGNPYAHLVSIGRSSSNDIAVAVDSVSKVHGYFALDEERWCFTDHDSTNGSLLNDQPLRAGQKNTLADGDILQLGLEVTLEYFSPGRLYERVTRRR